MSFDFSVESIPWVSHFPALPPAHYRRIWTTDSEIKVGQKGTIRIGSLLVVIYIYIFFFHGGAGTRFKFIINSIVFAYLMRVKSADSGKKRANFPGGAWRWWSSCVRIRVEMSIMLCVCDDVMWLCVCINYNKFKTGPAHYHISVVIEIC